MKSVVEAKKVTGANFSGQVGEGDRGSKEVLARKMLKRGMWTARW